MRYEPLDRNGAEKRTSSLTHVRHELVEEFRVTASSRIRGLKESYTAGDANRVTYPARLVGELRTLHWEATLMGFASAAAVIDRLARLVSSQSVADAASIRSAIDDALSALAPRGPTRCDPG